MGALNSLSHHLGILKLSCNTSPFPMNETQWPCLASSSDQQEPSDRSPSPGTCWASRWGLSATPCSMLEGAQPAAYWGGWKDLVQGQAWTKSARSLKGRAQPNMGRTGMLGYGIWTQCGFICWVHDGLTALQNQSGCGQQTKERVGCELIWLSTRMGMVGFIETSDISTGILLLIFFQPFKNFKTTVSLWAIQNRWQVIVYNPWQS
jgi:hypothetical protein